MSRSYNKVAGGTCGGCRSRKKGKQACHRKFRRNGSYSKMLEAMDEWNLGGDGKTVYTWDTSSELYKRSIRK